MSRTSDAMAWVAEDRPNRSYYAAAKKFGLNQSALTAAKHRERRRTMLGVCPTCGATLPVKSPPVPSGP